MNELTSFEIEVKDGIQTVSARELHEKLRSAERFSKWWERFVQYGFIEGSDFTTVLKSTVVNNGAKRELTDYAISIEMAKQICMLQRTELGRKYREYFLNLEKAWKSPEAVMARALQVANELLVKQKADVDRLLIENKEQKQQLIEQAPKVEFYDTVTKSESTFDMAEVAKLLKIPNMGSVKLFEFLRSKDVLSDVKTNWNEPYQNYVNAGYFKIVETKSEDKHGNVHVNKKTVVFQKGVDFIRKLAKDDGLIKNRAVALF